MIENIGIHSGFNLFSSIFAFEFLAFGWWMKCVNLLEVKICWKELAISGEFLSIWSFQLTLSINLLLQSLWSIFRRDWFKKNYLNFRFFYCQFMLWRVSLWKSSIAWSIKYYTNSRKVEWNCRRIKSSADKKLWEFYENDRWLESYATFKASSLSTKFHFHRVFSVSVEIRKVFSVQLRENGNIDLSFFVFVCEVSCAYQDSPATKQ